MFVESNLIHTQLGHTHTYPVRAKSMAGLHGSARMQDNRRHPTPAFLCWLPISRVAVQEGMQVPQSNLHSFSMQMGRKGWSLNAVSQGVSGIGVLHPAPSLEYREDWEKEL